MDEQEQVIELVIRVPAGSDAQRIIDDITAMLESNWPDADVEAAGTIDAEAYDAEQEGYDNGNP